MKYQSELVKEIVDNRGHEKSSLHYQSECIEAWIQETKGAYPKLCDYEGEWLNYIANEEHIGEFPYETVTANPTATVNNVVPYSYKSAILRGQTLVNLSGKDKISGAEFCFYENGVYKYSQDINHYYDSLIFKRDNVKMFSPNKTYTFIIDSKVLKSEVDGYTNPPRHHGIIIRFEDDTYQTPFTLTQNVGERVERKIKFTIENKPIKDVSIRTFTTGLQKIGVFNGEVYKMILVEGDYTNVDIPYFEGMQSVKMPVLTTTGKNLFNYKNYVGQNEGIVEVENGLRVAGWARSLPFINNLLPDTTYTSKSVVTVIEESVGAIDTGAGKILIYNGTTYLTLFEVNGCEHTFTTPTNIKSYDRILFYAHGGGGSNTGVVDITNMQIEEGTTATSYEPYKSNILTVNEDVELRGVGDVKDELNVATGELTQRIEKYTNLSNSFCEPTTFFPLEGHTTFSFGDWRYKLKSGYYSLLSNKLPYPLQNEGVYFDGYSLFLRIKNDKLTTLDRNGLNEWLIKEDFTIMLPMKTETVKTVDLNVTNQDGVTIGKIKPIEGTMNIEVSGTPIHPTAVLEVPVEAITQNLTSFINE